jgi:hypothetical protein
LGSDVIFGVNLQRVWRTESDQRKPSNNSKRVNDEYFNYFYESQLQQKQKMIDGTAVQLAHILVLSLQLKSLYNTELEVHDFNYNAAVFESVTASYM